VLDTLKRIIYWSLRPAVWLLLRVLPLDDPWERLAYRVPVRSYGLGAKHDFGWYFEGETSVTVATLEDVQDWLIACSYVRDPELFHEEDFWQHPTTFERLRQGDCEDHALWAWRKLVELGYDADLVSGRCLPWDPKVAGADRGHVWVVFRKDGDAYLFESVAKSRDRMIRPLSDVAVKYRPEFGVDRSRQRFAFNGFLLTWRDREFGVRNRESRRSA